MSFAQVRSFGPPCARPCRSRGLARAGAQALKACAPEIPRAGCLRPRSSAIAAGRILGIATVCVPPLPLRGCSPRRLTALFISAHLFSRPAATRAARRRCAHGVRVRPVLRGPASAGASAPASGPHCGASPAGSHPFTATRSPGISAAATGGPPLHSTPAGAIAPAPPHAACARSGGGRTSRAKPNTTTCVVADRR